MTAQDGPRCERRPGRRSWAVGAAMLLALVGCTRRYYRDFADSDVYRIERERMTDPRWAVPPRLVEADPRSRIGDKHDPNHEPIQNDDPGARPFQFTAGRPFEFLGWLKRGTAPVEDMSWLDEIPRGPDGKLRLDAPMAMRVALKNNRDYQTRVEDVYLQALSLTLTRFSFFPQMLANQATQFYHFGADKTETNQLQLLGNAGLNWTLYSGATLLTNFANAITFQYNGKGFETVVSGLTINLTQPLLQGAFARNVTQPLSLQERQTLYTVRSFAEYRRTFYVNTVSGYLGLMTQLQTIRNNENNVNALRRNLDEYEALVKAGLIDPLQRDNVAQQYQSARLTLLQSEANFQTALDAYRVTQLGLPADFPATLDESLLKKFELNDPRLDDLRKSNDALYLSLLQYTDPPPRTEMAKAAKKALAELKQLQEISKVVGVELKRWRDRLAADKGRVGTGSGPTEADERESYQRQTKLAGELASGFDESRESLSHDITNTEDYIESLAKAAPDDAFKELRQEIVGRKIRERQAELFVIQTQARVYLIEVAPVALTVERAISVGLANRLDLMNSLAQVTDAWRNVEVAGNQLLAGLSLYYIGNLATAPNHAGLVRFDLSNSSQVAGVRFDAPINRRAQRNTYRLDQVVFQQARRAYMLNHDQVVQGIRLDMRNLNLNRRQFEIGREQLLIAARQVDLAESNARNTSAAQAAAPGGQSASLLLLNALNSLLAAKNGLIDNWVAYEINRMGLYRDFDLMTIDAQGIWTNDGNLPNLNGGPAPATPDPVGAPVERLLPGPASSGSATGEIPPLPPPPAGAPGPFARP
jgi:outer membrane protein TolC